MAIWIPLPSQAADEISDGQWFHTFLRTSQAQELSTGSGITVAVIDSGVDATHPDLLGSVLPGVDFTADGKGTGHLDVSGHGTGMAAIVAGHGRVRGIAPGAKILPVRVFTKPGTGRVTADSVRWAVEHGADVISISMGSGTADPAVRLAIEEAIRQNVVVVAAAGNRPEDRDVVYPAAFPGVIAVGGVGKDGELSTSSVTGHAISVAAPADGITSAGLDHRWSIGSGTSGATAIVAGAAALIRAKFPELSAAGVADRLTSTAVDKGYPGRDPQYGFGVLNLMGALTADASPSAVEPSATASPAGPSPDGSHPWVWVLAAIAVGGVLVLAFRSRRRG
ncbi:type VII secretion-associated serine protease mycosin [Catellatospora chokoriensis]|uniref:Type VII secretion-associated serine protease n=2 Tax=Catellatospora chokoriensis TaxID=310353 RepID=A0A8J3K381_9ACTN|nr:type VII secretion-associated serine protease [Catellatospora chokoriensis]